MKPASKGFAAGVVFVALAFSIVLALKTHAMKLTRANIIACEAAAESDRDARGMLYGYQVDNRLLSPADAETSGEFIAFLYDKDMNKCGSL